MRLGIFGGTFDPIHLGHVIIAGEILDSGLVDKVLFVPAGKPWMKSGQCISLSKHRLAMVTLAIENNPEFLMSDIEVQRPRPTYTIETLKELASTHHPTTSLYLVLGADTVADLARWHMPRQLFDLATIIVVNRAGARSTAVASPDPFGEAARQVHVEAPAIGISSTEIRERVARGRSIRYLVPPGVEEYIIKHELYRTC